MSSTFIFSIPFVVPKSLFIVYNKTLDFITYSNLLNFFKSNIICCSTVFFIFVLFIFNYTRFAMEISYINYNFSK